MAAKGGCHGPQVEHGTRRVWGDVQLNNVRNGEIKPKSRIRDNVGAIVGLAAGPDEREREVRVEAAGHCDLPEV